MQKMRIGTGVILLATVTILSFQNCQNQGMVASSYTDETGFVYMDAIGKRCAKPWDPTSFIDADESITVYQSGILAEGKSCFAEERVCQDGKLSGNFGFPSCMILPNSSNDCSGAWSGAPIIKDGVSVTAYLITQDGSCMPETRTCMKGVLSGTASLAACPSATSCKTAWGLQLGEGQSIKVLDDIGTPAPANYCGSNVYTYTCSQQILAKTVSKPACAPASCYAPWGTLVEHNGAIAAYKANVVPNGQKCNDAANIQTRKCTNGTLSGSYSFGICKVAKKPCTLPWDTSKTIADGENVTAWDKNVSRSVNTCQSEVRTCNNGVLSGTYSFKACTVSTKSCKTPWGATILNGGTFVAWKSPYGVNEPCVSATIQCFDGDLAGIGYQNKSCIQDPKSCSLGKVTIKHGESKTAYYSGGGSCLRQVRKCTNGDLNGDDKYNTFVSCN